MRCCCHAPHQAVTLKIPLHPNRPGTRAPHPHPTPASLSPRCCLLLWTGRRCGPPHDCNCGQARCEADE
eukprot:365688-Chlamydomonas_euryale.AAC.5